MDTNGKVLLFSNKLQSFTPNFILRMMGLNPAINKKERAGCFAFIVFGMSCYCKCPVALPHVAVGWSAVCDCDIS